MVQYHERAGNGFQLMQVSIKKTYGIEVWRLEKMLTRLYSGQVSWNSVSVVI